MSVTWKVFGRAQHAFSSSKRPVHWPRSFHWTNSDTLAPTSFHWTLVIDDNAPVPWVEGPDSHSIIVKIKLLERRKYIYVWVQYWVYCVFWAVFFCVLFGPVLVGQSINVLQFKNPTHWTASGVWATTIDCVVLQIDPFAVCCFVVEVFRYSLLGDILCFVRGFEFYSRGRLFHWHWFQLRARLPIV